MRMGVKWLKHLKTFTLPSAVPGGGGQGHVPCRVAKGWFSRSQMEGTAAFSRGNLKPLFTGHYVFLGIRFLRGGTQRPGAGGGGGGTHPRAPIFTPRCAHFFFAVRVNLPFVFVPILSEFPLFRDPKFAPVCLRHS